jgi:hypothetical protein
MKKLRVSYNGKELYPTPIVNYNHQPISFGYVYGYNTSITLEGVITGIQSDYSVRSYLTGIFDNQFKILKVEEIDLGNEEVKEIYAWENTHIENISLEQSQYLKDSLIKYNIKCSSFNFPSGIIDPSNEYSFSQNEDGTVNVNRKISARGVKNNLGAFQNAVDFVKSFTGKDSFSNCASYFIPKGTGVLLSISESIDRLEGLYSVNEIYKYNTGISSEAISVSSLDMDESLGAEFRSINYNLKINGSPIYKNTNAILENYLNYNVLQDIQTRFNVDTSKWIKNNYSASVDSGSATIDIKINYYSGANASGFFDYIITCEKDNLIGTENWKIDGEFRCFGPLDYKINRLNAFKQAYKTGSWRDYLSQLIVNSDVYSSLHDPNKMFSQNFNVNQDENLKLATLKLNLSMNMGYEPVGLSELKYSINGSPSKWIYEISPSANIEGNFVVQNLETKTNGSLNVNISARTYDKEAGLNLLKNYIDNISNIYVDFGTYSNVKSFLKEESYNTGTYDISYSKKFLGQIKDIDSTLINLRSIGSFHYNLPPRAPGYMFGY